MKIAQVSKHNRQCNTDRKKREAYFECKMEALKSNNNRRRNWKNEREEAIVKGLSN